MRRLSSFTGIRRLQIFAFIFVIAMTGAARGQNTGTGSPSGEPDEDELAREVDDPTAILTQLKFQDLYTPRNFQSSAQTNTFQIRPVIPVEPFPCFPFKQVIRPTLELQTLATSQSSATTTQFADMELFDLFISNWPDPKTTGFGWAIGPTFVFPTGRVPSAGKHAWQAGPAAAAVYKGIPHLMLAFLYQNPISFAYTNTSATSQSQFKFQPLISYTLGHGWYVKSADSTWTVDLRHGGSTRIPLSFGFGKVWKFEGVELNPWTAAEWMAYRQYTSITPMYTVRFGMTLLFPDFEL
ncbi:MAG TPA: hypothetical protein VMU16_06705 [Candidatus Binataceae bacterium]|nr:hypothetical protein [Candidatus Binataceae bacterium]